jgi:hypothetical protein
MEISVTWQLASVKDCFYGYRNYRMNAVYRATSPGARAGDAMKDQRMTPRPAKAPASCATMNIGTSTGAIPEKLFVAHGRS